MNYKIEHQEGDEGQFFIRENDEKLGFLDYTIENKMLIIQHTEVGDKLKGTGSAKKLVNEAKAYAEAQGYEISAQCSYAAHVLERQERP